MPQDQGTRQGYLLLADISRYTAFLTGTEFEHAHGIINELTRLPESLQTKSPSSPLVGSL